LIKVRLPKVFDLVAGEGASEVWYILTAAGYGLRESPRYWGIARDKELKKIKFCVDGEELSMHQAVTDSNMWLLKNADGLIRAVCFVHVDDLLITSDRLEYGNGLIQALSEVWTLSSVDRISPGHIEGADLTSKFCGLELEYVMVNDEWTLRVHQESYTRMLLQKHNMTSATPRWSPMEGVWPSMESVDYTPSELLDAQEKVGELLWLTRTRDDLLLVTSLCSSLLTRNPVQASSMAKGVLRYLVGTAH
jgi:hypothetical protein